MIEKRKSFRARTAAVVSFKVQLTRLAGGSRIKDISESGICLLVKSHLSIGTIIELEIRSDDLQGPLKIVAQVVRIVNRDKSNYPFEVGLVFLQLTIAKQRSIHDYISFLTAQGGDKSISWLD